jgi:hypothetical protein
MRAGVMALARVNHIVKHASNIHLDLKIVMAGEFGARESCPRHVNGITDAWKQREACERKDRITILGRQAHGKDRAPKTLYISRRTEEKGQDKRRNMAEWILQQGKATLSVVEDKHVIS